MPKTELNNTYPKVCFRIIDTDSHIVLQENVMKTWDPIRTSGSPVVTTPQRQLETHFSPPHQAAGLTRPVIRTVLTAYRDIIPCLVALSCIGGTEGPQREPRGVHKGA
ncbi:hypothetical protein F2P81_003563 [Scophthalmus maximus]|uniref:Uncharacterized protein n=1 Tax=Scophthalmus maximus TaxID=52904 RepID=A0A6A4TGS9_SCOMX|nr:hypothetical protein F2P81_003563 [Scophthalmus maximus]